LGVSGRYLLPLNIKEHGVRWVVLGKEKDTGVRVGGIPLSISGRWKTYFDRIFFLFLLFFCIHSGQICLVLRF
jgi:hypothetical protein